MLSLHSLHISTALRNALSRNSIVAAGGHSPLHCRPPQAPQAPIEVEVKLRLLSAADHQRLTAVLSPNHRATHLQENLFFDTPHNLLSSNLAALRIRFYGADGESRCVLSLKSKPQISKGVSRIEEIEEPIDPKIGRLLAAEPRRILEMGGSSSGVVARLREDFAAAGELVGLGGFRNLRGVYDWEGLKLEVDETRFDFGTWYEVECESDEPEKAKEMIEELLTSEGIGYGYSEFNKFALFLRGNLPD